MERVYVQSNAAERNEIIAFDRADDGRLEQLGSYESVHGELISATQPRKNGGEGIPAELLDPHTGIEDQLHRSGRKSGKRPPARRISTRMTKIILSPARPSSAWFRR